VPPPPHHLAQALRAYRTRSIFTARAWRRHLHELRRAPWVRCWNCKNSTQWAEKTCITFTGHWACFLAAQLGPLTFFRQTRGLGPLTIIRTKLLTKPDRQPHESIDLSICSSSLRARPTKRDDARRRALSRTDCGVPRL
jgi:hypothetical protein